MGKPAVIRGIQDWRAARAAINGSPSIGFVPTMGALHQGHGALLRRSRAENSISILSIYINPTQFDDPNDLRKYPRTLEADLELAERHGVDLVFMPEAAEMYPDDYRYRVQETRDSTRLCGAHRPGHFDGVLTVVLKLFMLVRPDRAYFGEKDYQQLTLIKGMAEAFFLDLAIVPCPTVREPDGLAMSSRNRHLSPEDRERAAVFNQLLKQGPTAEAAAANLVQVGFEVDYVENWMGRRCGAVRVGGSKTRLIDNVKA